MNNKTTAQRVSFILGLSLLIILGCLAGSFFVDIEKVEYFQIISGILLLFIIVIYLFGGYYYIEIVVERGHFLSFRHYRLFPFGRKFKVFQIEQKKFEKFEVSSYFFGIFSFLFLYEKSKKGIARYPGIGLSAIPKAQHKYIIAYIDKFLNTN
ncbi:MAG: hypothetical protein FWH18_01180 [Marinilabiliaceae bacterium]|nr:hypothetical protein [Marinilabiliaceae bacterium]